jgi:hypothetical protein
LSKEVSLTIQERVNLEGILLSQRVDPESMFLLEDIRSKVKLTDDERDLYLQMLPDGSLGLVKGFESAPEIVAEFSSSELRKMKSVLEGWKNYSLLDRNWYQNLTSKLT